MDVITFDIVHTNSNEKTVQFPSQNIVSRVDLEDSS